MATLETVSDMMRALQEEIEQVKAGTLTESSARVVGRFRSLQLKTAELQLQYHRMTKGKNTEFKLLQSGNGSSNGEAA